MINETEATLVCTDAVKIKMDSRNDHKKNKAWLTSELMALLCVLNASIGLFANGAFVGWSSYAIDILPEMFSLQENMRLLSTVALGATISPLIIHKFWHMIGSKRIILASNVAMVASWILSTFSEYYWCMLIGRGVGGIAVGALHLLIPMYINDIASAEQKPLYHTIVQLQFVVGILSQYILRLLDSFVLVNVFPAFVSALLFVLFLLFAPESPRFLASKGEIDEAKSILLKFKSIDRDVENEVQIWSGAHHKNGILNGLKEDIGIKNAVPLFGLFMFEQLIGAVSILFYLNKILTLTESDYSPEVTAIICGGVFALSVLLSNFVKFGFASIRSHLMWSSNLMAISLCLLGYYCHYQGTFGHIYTEDYRQLPWLCLGIFYFLYATGPYRLTHVYAEQMIPKKCYFSIRCLLTATSWCLIYTITRMLPRLIDIIGVGWLFWFMAIMCIFMAAFVKLFVPDVKRLPEEFKLVDSSESFSEA